MKNLVSVLFVKDIEISKDFYSNVLRQQINFDFGTNIIYKSGFAIWQIRDNHVIPGKLGLDKVQDKTVNRFELCFETEDIDKVYKDLKTNNVKFLHELTEEIWGQQTIRFFDPDNHLIEVGETLEQFVLRFYKQGMSIQQVSERTHVPISEVEHLINNDLKILSAEISDLSTILELQKDCYISEAKLVDDYSIPPLTQNLASIKQDFEKTTILKGVINGQIIASVRGYVDNSTCFIGRLIVHQAYQNKGIGCKIIQAIEDQFSNCDRYELFTGEKSLKNLHLYNKIGYNEFKRERLSEKVTFVFLEKINRK
jgi:catechol 2,3-dioxygenase-like lactoylglutathione lyase family enzyme/N-acetylglutamate synthase-like GNAT family acetyltransferase